MQVDVDDVMKLLGEKELELAVLRKKLMEALKRIEELTPKPQAPQ